MTNSGIDLISQERKEQIEKHGYTIQGDVKANDEYQLIDAVGALITPIPEGFEDDYLVSVHSEYPPIGWNKEIWIKMLKKSYKDRLVVAGALISAEIDRLENVKPV